MSDGSFPAAARAALADAQLRANLRRATTTIRAKRAAVTEELADWQALRDAAAAVKERTLAELDRHLERLEVEVRRAGGEVHWARDAAEANAAVVAVARRAGARRVVKVKSLTTDETGLNRALAQAGVEAVETDLAELIVQLGDDRPSHILVPAIHKNRSEIRDLFARRMGLPHLTDDPKELTAAARSYLRQQFLSAGMAVSGANFAVAETGSVAVVESEGNGRMCLTLPRVLVTVMGIEKVIPRWRDLEVFLQVLPRSSTGERMNPYTSIWRGVRPGDGPDAFHLVIVDNGRSRALADPVGRPALRCIRCSACLNVCPVYERVGGHAYGSVYPGPIGAILAPQLEGLERRGSLPYASSLCGACADVCPVKIPIPSILVHLRGEAVARAEAGGRPAERLAPEALAMRALGRALLDVGRYEGLQRAARLGQRPFVRSGRIRHLPGPLEAWTRSRDLVPVPPQSFRDWWRSRT